MADRRTRLLIFGKLPPPIMGPAMATQRLLASSLKDDFDLLHIDTRINKAVADMGRKDPMKVFGILRIYWRLLKTLIGHRPDIAIIPISQTTIGFLKDSPLILLCRLFDCKGLVQLRGSDMENWLDSADELTRWWFRWCMGRSNGAIVLGENLRYLFEPYFAADRIHVIPNGGDFPLPAPSPSRADGPIVLLSVANHLPGKGLHQILAALDQMDTDGIPAFEYHAFGSWDDQAYRSAAEDLAERIGKDKVFIHASISGKDKWQRLVDADIYLFCPIAPEGHPWSVVEAMAAGLPIISSDQGAIVESVKDGENGYIVDPKDTEQLASRIRELIGSAPLRKELAVRSRAFYEDGFTEKKMIERYTRLVHSQG